MDAWIDCLTYLDEGDGMSRFKLAPNEALEPELLNSDQLKRGAPDLYTGLIECAGFVNQRYVDRGKSPVLRLVLK